LFGENLLDLDPFQKLNIGPGGKLNFQIGKKGFFGAAIPFTGNDGQGNSVGRSSRIFTGTTENESSRRTQA
jgi:hypothetical protein